MTLDDPYEFDPVPFVDDQWGTNPVPTPVALVPPGAPAPSGGGGGNGGGGGTGGGSGLSASPVFNFGPAPIFTPPQFTAPTFEQAQQEPGYQFRLAGGRQALEGSASARGTLRTGGTLRDITEYGQNFAAQEYGNVYNRALQSFDRLYRGQYDAFQPRMQAWAFLSGAEQARALAAFQRELQIHQLNKGGGGGGGGGNPPAPPPPLPPGGPPFNAIRVGDPLLDEIREQYPGWGTPGYTGY